MQYLGVTAGRYIAVPSPLGPMIRCYRYLPTLQSLILMPDTPLYSSLLFSTLLHSYLQYSTLLYSSLFFPYSILFFPFPANSSTPSFAVITHRNFFSFPLCANYSPTKSLVPPTRFQNLNPNPDPWTLTLHLTLTNIVGGTRDLVGE